MVINVSIQYNGGFLPDIILLTQGYFICCPYMAINVIVQYNGGFFPDILLLTQAPIVVSYIITTF